MILSFNPVITAEENINCAGRPPGPEERKAISCATAIILPQGVREDLYRLCAANCLLVWPDYTARFDYPGKVGQALLFARLDLPRPQTVVFPSVDDFNRQRCGALPRPFVLKTNLGGQGGGIFLVTGEAELDEALQVISQEQKLGRGGFVQQEYIDHGGRDLRVVIVGDRKMAYWRRAGSQDGFLTNLAAGGQVDFESDPDLIKMGLDAVDRFSDRVGVELAGVDLMFDRRAPEPQPLFIEVNYYFGRRALGGSRNYYRLLNQAVAAWLDRHGLKIGLVRSHPRYSDRD